MPSVTTQPAQYMRNLDSLRIEARDDKANAEEKLRQALKLLDEQQDYVQRSVDAHVGFCMNPRKYKPYRVFISWFDHALQCRVVLEKSELGVVAVPLSTWSKNHKLIEHYRPNTDLLPGFTALRQTLQLTSKQLNAVKQMLTAVGYDIPERTTLPGLHVQLSSSENFTEVKDETEG